MKAKESSTNKFFTIQFIENSENDAKTTKVPARKGKSLKESLEPIFINHNLSFETHSVFLESSKTPLPLASETFPYGGCVLYARANEAVNVDKRIFSMMKDDGSKSPDPVAKRFTGLLAQYEEHGFGDSDNVDGPTDNSDGELFLETSWKDVINIPEDFPGRQRVQQEAIWELMTTEVIYIKDLKIVIDIFQKCFLMLQKEGYFEDVDKVLIYSNVEEILEVNLEFWRLLKGVVKEARNTKQPIKPRQLIDAFDEFEDIFQPYITFCNSDLSNMKLPSYSPSTNEMLKEYFTWCDNHEKCKRIHLTGFLIKPLQRVTKYSLLLRAILNKTDDEGERSLLEVVMSRVETFVSKINSAVHMRQEYEKLISILAKFDTYSPVEPANDEAEKIMAEYNSLDLKIGIPGLLEDEKRFMLKDGPMKIIEKQQRKDTHVFLFSDVIVFTKLKKNIDKYRVIKQPFRLNKVVLRVMKDPGYVLFIYLNEYGVLANAFVLQMNPSEQSKWFEVVENAKIKYEETRTEYGFTKENFIDDELPNSPMIKNKQQNRLSYSKLQRNAAVKRSRSKKEMPKNFIYDWTNTRIVIGATIFCLINVLLSRMLGY